MISLGGLWNVFRNKLVIQVEYKIVTEFGMGISCDVKNSKTVILTSHSTSQYEYFIIYLTIPFMLDI